MSIANFYIGFFGIGILAIFYGFEAIFLLFKLSNYLMAAKLSSSSSFFSKGCFLFCSLGVSNTNYVGIFGS
jgi:hypothetical protein